jgi:hypothetical protein
MPMEKKKKKSDEEGKKKQKKDWRGKVIPCSKQEAEF